MSPILLTFLHAAIPLAKQFTKLADNTVKCTKVYPCVSNVTSTDVTIDSPKELFNALSEYANSQQKHCLLKGRLTRALINESRKAMCLQDTATRFCVLDLDKAPFSSPAEFMKAIGLEKLTFIWQWSSSAKINKDKTISGHIFILLDKEVHPRMIRAWLMSLNFEKEILRKSIRLSNSKAALHWPLDIVVNDNGRIIYIAEPSFVGMKSPIPTAERIQFFNGQLNVLDTSTMSNTPIETLKATQKDIINALRVEAGLKPNRTKIKQKGEFEVQEGVGEATNYEVIDDGGDYIRYNLNGGDSQAYWHPRSSFELLHSFKGEPSLLLKEIMPTRYAELTATAKIQNVTPNKDGDIIIAFRNKHTNEYLKGTWNETNHVLDVQTTRSELVLCDFMKEFGAPIGDFIPQWTVKFDPTSDVVYSQEKRTLNSFVATPLLRGVYQKPIKSYPTIQRVLDHAIGTGAIQEHFLNWLAVIMQHRIKTTTGWILHGTEGTGKGLLINYVLEPIFKQYLTIHKASELQHQFNGWMETALLAFVDEIEADVFEKRSMEGDLRAAITEPVVPIRRMRVDTYGVPSYINFIFSSNKPQPVKLQRADRRFNVGNYQPERLVITVKEVKAVIPSEVESFCDYMLNRPACIDKAAAIMHNEARAVMQALSLTSIDEFADNVMNGDLKKLWEYMPDERLLLEHGLMNPATSAYVHLIKRFTGELTSNITRDELAMMFTHTIGKVPEGANKFTTYLRHHGINTKKVWNGCLSTYGITITWNVTADERVELLQGLQSKINNIKNSQQLPHTPIPHKGKSNAGQRRRLNS